LLETTDGHKYTCVHVTQELWLELILRTYDGIVSKINACKKFGDYPEHNTFAAGLYTYAIEEFGKLLILKDSRRLKSSNKRELSIVTDLQIMTRNSSKLTCISI
jgi:hypothetical protein